MNTVLASGWVRAFAPATVANLTCGFDVLGLAIAAPYDEVVARRATQPGVRISIITGDGGRLPYEPERNTAAVAVQALLAARAPATGIELEIHKHLPLGSGLGSSAASAVAAAVAANALLGSPCTRAELLPFALAGEQVASGGGAAHADNVAPCLLGGIALVRCSEPLDVVALPVPAELYCTVVHPQLVVPTAEARALLPTSVPLGAAIKQWGNVGALVASLYREDYALLARALRDDIVEPARAHLIPNFGAVKAAALAAGALGCGISGACPSVFALSRSEGMAQAVGQVMQQAFTDVNLGSECYVSPVNQEGARLQ